MDVPSSNGRLCTSTALAVFDNDFETPFSVASQTSIPLPDPATMQLESSKEGSLERQEFRPSEDTIMAPNGSVLGSKRSFNNMVTSGAPTATAEAPGETQSFSSSSSTTSSSRSFDVPSNSRTSSSGYYEARTLISGRSTAGEICELQNALRQMNRSESCKPPTFARTPRARAATFNHLNLHPRLPALAAAMKGWKRCAAPPPPSIDLDNSTSISSPATSPNMMKATLPGALSFQSNTAAAPPAAMRPAGSGVNVMDRACAAGVHIPLMSPSHFRSASCTYSGSPITAPALPEGSNTERGCSMQEGGTLNIGQMTYRSRPAAMLDPLPPPMMMLPPSSTRRVSEPNLILETILGVYCEQTQSTEDIGPSGSGGEREEMEQLASPELVMSRRACFVPAATTSIGLAFDFSEEDDPQYMRRPRSGWQSPRSRPTTPNLRARSSELNRDHLLVDLPNFGRRFSYHRSPSPEARSTSSSGTTRSVNAGQGDLFGAGLVAVRTGSVALHSSPSSPLPSGWRLPRLRFGSLKKSLVETSVSAVGTCASASTFTSSRDSTPITSPQEARTSDWRCEGTFLPSSGSSTSSCDSRDRPHTSKYPQQRAYSKDPTTSYVSGQRLPPLIVDRFGQFPSPTDSPLSLGLATWTTSPIDGHSNGSGTVSTAAPDREHIHKSGWMFDLQDQTGRCSSSSIHSSSSPLLHAINSPQLHGEPASKPRQHRPEPTLRPPEAHREGNGPDERMERSTERSFQTQVEQDVRLMEAQLQEWSFVTSMT